MALNPWSCKRPNDAVFWEIGRKWGQGTGKDAAKLAFKGLLEACGCQVNGFIWVGVFKGPEWRFLMWPDLPHY